MLATTRNVPYPRPQSRCRPDPFNTSRPPNTLAGGGTQTPPVTTGLGVFHVPQEPHMYSKTVSTSGTAQTVTIDSGTIQTITIVNLSATAAEYVSCTVAVNSAPTTAVVDANNTVPVQAGEAVPIDVGNTNDARVSVIAASGTPKVCVIGN